MRMVPLSCLAGSQLEVAKRFVLAVKRTSWLQRLQKKQLTERGISEQNQVRKKGSEKRLVREEVAERKAPPRRGGPVKK